MEPDPLDDAIPPPAATNIPSTSAAPVAEPKIADAIAALFAHITHECDS